MRHRDDQRAPETFKESEGRFRALLDTAPDAMVVVGKNGRIVFVNVRTETLFGYARAELLGQHLELLIPERFRSAHDGHVADFFGSPGMRPMGSGLELFGRHKDGTEIPIEVSLSPLRTEHEVTVSAAIRDISDRKRLEAEVRQAAQELREARVTADAANGAKSEFLSSMSHELRTPLNAILGFSQLMERDKKEPLSERHRNRVAQILKGGEHLLRLIDDVLDLSRIEAGGLSISPEPVSVHEVLEEVKETVEPMAVRQGICIEVECAAAEWPVVSADRTRFAQILLNFASNAIKYNRPAGKVMFTVSRPKRGHVRVGVGDTGIGIPEEKQDKLFQPFQRAGQETGPIEGTGIGLVITKRLAQLMNGDVGFRSVPGEGSEFWVEIPAHESGLKSGRRTIARDPGSARRIGRRGLVLYVEDNPANVEFMLDLVDLFEHVDLITAPTAEVGLELARERRPAVVIMDINLPGSSGLEALRSLREAPETRAIPVIALTAAASERDLKLGKQAGFYRYLTKPVVIEELVATLEGLLVAS